MGKSSGLMEYLLCNHQSLVKYYSNLAKWSSKNKNNFFKRGHRSRNKTIPIVESDPNKAKGANTFILVETENYETLLLT